MRLNYRLLFRPNWVIACLFMTIIGSGDSACAEGRRVALVIGISAYEPPLQSLHTAQRDARAVGNALRAAQFDVTEEPDPSADDLKRALSDFTNHIQHGDVALVYFAGHGVQVNGHNYLLPSDFKPVQASLSTAAIDASEVLRMMGERSPALKILILDACRDNPLNFGAARGLAEMQAGSYGGGTYIALAAAPGQRASDGVFAKFLVAEIDRPGQSIGDAFINVRSGVEKETGGAQSPISTDQQRIAFIFVPLPIADPDTALSTLDRISSMLPTGEAGETKALESLTASGRSLSGTTILRGLSFQSAILNHGNLAKADLTGSNFSHAAMRNANLSSTTIHFGDLSAVDLTAADLTDASLAFANFESARAPGSKMANSRWFGSRAANADFSSADLEGASFYLADLRGAKFIGANLKNAVFVASLLQGADFTGATIANTDITDSSIDFASFKAPQLQQFCKTPYLESGDVHPGVVGVSVDIVKKIPGAQFSGGVEYHPTIEKKVFLPLNNPSSLPVCSSRPNSQKGSVALFRLENGLEYVTNDWRAAYEAKLLDAGERESAFKQIIDAYLESIRINRDPDAKVKPTTSTAQFRQPPFSVPSKISLTEDTTILLILRDHPELANRLDWRRLASDRVRSEIEIANQTNKEVPWGRFFPERTYPEQVSPELVDAYKEWTSRRAQKMPTVVTMTLQPWRKGPSGQQTLSLFGNRLFNDSLLSLRESGIDERCVINYPAQVAAVTVKGDDTFSLSHFLILLPREAKSYEWSFTDDQQTAIRSRWSSTNYWTPGGELDFVVTSTKLDQKRGIFIVEARPKQFRMMENKQVIFSMNDPSPPLR